MEVRDCRSRFQIKTMNLNVLIVEDQFLEAENLSIILKNAGHKVHGIAKSVDQAIDLLKKCSPDIVLVDIVLKGDLNGIDLARILDKKNIPFIFLSANSNATTLEQAIVTKPYGFLVKPFREKELLIALDIAVYRYQKNIELTRSSRQSPIPKAPNQLLIPGIEGIIGNSPKLIEALDKVIQVAPFDNTVLIFGETGVGKEGIVKAIHDLSPRKGHPLIKVNCAAIPVNLVESELFGHERGAFTGATERRVGKFEQANCSTLFLDEIGELPVEIQSKLLRALQEKEIERVGGRATIKTNVRIIAATNRNLLTEIAAGRFRMDLYYRINVFPICLPPLRERRGDIPALTDYFLKHYGSHIKAERMSLSAAALKQLEDYSWPGNIRELQHLIERHVLQSRSNCIESFEMPDGIPGNEFLPATEPEIKPYVEMDRQHIISALKKANGKISGRGGAAELLRLRPTTLTSKMKRLGIDRTI